MPFKKTGKDTYTSPTGRHFNGAQVRLYYANGGHFPGEKGYAEGGMVTAYAKGGDIAKAGYAKGGPALGRTREFLKEPVDFRDPGEGDQEDNDNDNFYAKSGEGAGKGVAGGPPAKRTGDKSLKTIKPRG